MEKILYDDNSTKRYRTILRRELEFKLIKLLQTWFCACASVYMCFVVTLWERADLLALVCGVCCEFVTSPLVSLVRCGT